MWKQYPLIRCRPLPLGGKLNTGPWHNKAETKWTPFRRRHFQKHFLNENVWISIKIPLKFVPKVWIKNIPALVQIMAWHRLGDKPLSEPMMVCSLTHICVTRPQWVKAETKLPTILQTKFVPNGPIDNIPALVQIMACPLTGAKPLSEPMMIRLWRIYVSLGLNELRLRQNDLLFCRPHFQIQLLTSRFLQCLPSVDRSCCIKNLMSVSTLKQNSGGITCGFTNIKSKWSMSRSNWKCSPVHKYCFNQSKWTFSTSISEGVHYVFPKVGEQITQHAPGSQHQAIKWTKDDIMAVACLGINFTEIRIKTENLNQKMKITKCITNILCDMSLIFFRSQCVKGAPIAWV